MNKLEQGTLPFDIQTTTESAEIDQQKTLEVDALTAAWMLFDFGKNRKNNDTKATQTISTLLPNGDLKVVTIEVQSFYEVEKNGVTKRMGLPGALCQDVYFALMDELVSQMRVIGDDESSSGQLPVTAEKIPKQVFFRQKDLMKKMGINPKSSPRVREALQHLHKTHISIKGHVYRDGEEERVTHDAYYVSALTLKENLKRGKVRQEWHEARFDDRLISLVLKGWIAQMDREKILALPSGAPRKLYALLTAKQRENPQASHVVITRDEIVKTLRIMPKEFKKLLTKYNKALLETGIIAGSDIGVVAGEQVVVYEMKEKQEVVSKPTNLHRKVEDYWKTLKKNCQLDPSMHRAVEGGNLKRPGIEDLLKKFDAMEKFGTRNFSQVILWADKIFSINAYNISIGKGKAIHNETSYLAKALKEKKGPTAVGEYQFVDQRVKTLETRAMAEKQVQTEQEEEKKKAVVMADRSENAFRRLNAEQKTKLVSQVRYKFKEYSLALEEDALVQEVATAYLNQAIENGDSVKDVSGIIQLIKGPKLPWVEQKLKLQDEKFRKEEEEKERLYKEYRPAFDSYAGDEAHQKSILEQLGRKMGLNSLSSWGIKKIVIAWAQNKVQLDDSVKSGREVVNEFFLQKTQAEARGIRETISRSINSMPKL